MALAALLSSMTQPAGTVRCRSAGAVKEHLCSDHSGGGKAKPPARGQRLGGAATCLSARQCPPALHRMAAVRAVVGRARDGRGTGGWFRLPLFVRRLLRRHGVLLVKLATTVLYLMRQR